MKTKTAKMFWGRDVTAKCDFRVVAAKKSPKKKKMYLYDVIGDPFITAEQVIEAAEGADELELHINSPGGDVFEGLAIYNYLATTEAKVTVHIDGVAASIASVIALAGDEILAHKASFYMIHNPWTIAMGNANQFEEVIGFLRQVEGVMLGIYEDATGIDQITVGTMLDEETWFSAEDALEAGFIDGILEDSEKGIKEEPKARFDLSIFANAPEMLLVAHQQEEKETEPTVRDLEKSLRDAGFSRRVATAAASMAFGEAQRDAESDKLAVELLTKIDLFKEI